MHEHKENTELLQARRFPKLTLGAIFLFAKFADAGEGLWSGEVNSFRSFTKEQNRSHRLMVKIVDRIEYQMQRLLIERTYRHSDGKMYVVADYAEAKVVKGKRVGSLTKYGRAWRQFAEHVANLYDMMMEVEDDDMVRQILRDQKKLLAQHRQMHSRLPREAEHFDGL